MTAEKKLYPLGITATNDGKDVAREVVKQHVAGTQTLVVVNTVKRAKAVYAAVKKDKTAPKDVLLVHSRFRPAEREILNDSLMQPGLNRIIIATQVVEAGVDISARTLITELAPWASVVQRIGRCNRTGKDDFDLSGGCSGSTSMLRSWRRLTRQPTCASPARS